MTDTPQTELVERFKITVQDCDPEIEAHPQGPWVTHRDYAKIASVLSSQAEEIEALKRERDKWLDRFQATGPAFATLQERVRVLESALEPFVKRAPVQGFAAGIPWDMHLRAYDAYCKEYSQQKALIEAGCRGGFGTRELDKFIPGWRDEVAADFRRARTAMEAKTDGRATPSGDGG